MPRYHSEGGSVATNASRQRKTRIDRPGSSERRIAIVELAGEIFAEKGFRGTTVRDIAQKADILSGSLYHHFDSKESIADEILRGYWDELIATYRQVAEEDGDPSTKVTDLIEASLQLFERHEHAVRMMLNDYEYLIQVLPYIEDHMFIVENIWRKVIAQGIATGDFRSDLDPLLSYRTIMSSISGTARWFRVGGRLPLSEVVTTMTTIFLNGLRGTPAPPPA